MQSNISPLLVPFIRFSFTGVLPSAFLGLFSF